MLSTRYLYEFKSVFNELKKENEKIIKWRIQMNSHQTYADLQQQLKYLNTKTISVRSFSFEKLLMHKSQQIYFIQYKLYSHFYFVFFFHSIFKCVQNESSLGEHGDRKGEKSVNRSLNKITKWLVGAISCSLKI